VSGPTVPERLHRWAAATVSGHRGNAVAKGLARLSRSYLDLYGNHSYDAERNGEFRVLSTLAERDVRCVFDVGANDGSWVLGAAALMPRTSFECFEIVPNTAQTLTQRTRPLGDRVTVNAVGLSNEPGTLDVRYYPGFSEGASAAGFEHPDMASEIVACEVTTGDAFCAAKGIEHIDLLKIDTEGLDLRVLQGFDRMLGTGAIDVVQFEYGLANISSRALLADFHAFLEERGFAVGKVWPHDVEFRAYDMRTDEDFRGPNYVAVHRSHADLLARLGGR
jgi:FkbM family methyltransferase